MAILGAQFVFSLVMFSFLQKISPYYSFARWLMCRRLVRYLHPTDDELKTQAGIAPVTKGKGRKGNDNKSRNPAQSQPAESFMIPRSLEIKLDVAKVEPIDLIPLHYFTEFKWLVDFSVSATIVYVATEIYYAISSHHIEFNVSILWCLLAIAFCLRVLVGQTALYFSTEDGGERILCITFGFFYLVFSMGVLVIGDHLLEFGLDEGYDNFSSNAANFLKQQGIESAGPLSFITFKIILAFTSAIIGALLTFPGLRFARLHSDSLKYAKENYFRQTILHLNYVLPLVVSLSYVKPIARNVFCTHSWGPSGAMMNDQVFDNVRILLVIAMVIVRVLLFATFMQSHLNLAYLKVEMLRKESGKISNIELQKLVAHVFYYVCVVAIQYIAPVLLITFLVFLLKTLGDYSWTAVLGERVTDLWSLKNSGPRSPVPVTAANDSSSVDSIFETAAHFSYTLGSLRTIFTPLWYRGLFSYLMWWVCTSWFTSSSLGMLYYSQADAF